MQMQTGDSNFAGGKLIADVEGPHHDSIALERGRIVVGRIVKFGIVAALDADDFDLAGCGFEFHLPGRQLRFGGIDGAELRWCGLNAGVGRWHLLHAGGQDAQYKSDDAAAGDAHGFSPPLSFTAAKATTSTSLVLTAPS